MFSISLDQLTWRTKLCEGFIKDIDEPSYLWTRNTEEDEIDVENYIKKTLRTILILQKNKKFIVFERY
jgi:hypothetical protein